MPITGAGHKYEWVESPRGLIQVFEGEDVSAFMKSSEEPTNWPEIAKQDVRDWVDKQMMKTGATKYDVYVVWFCFILGGWKALISTTMPDGLYFEVTYNKGKDETYLDVYRKTENIVIKH